MKFHPSSLGLLMTDAQSIDKSLVPAELLPLISKKTKTDAEKELLQPYKDMSLSAGAKTALKTMAKEFIFGYHKTIETKYMDKGLALEDAAIEFLNRHWFKNYEKNTVRVESEYLTGECDIFVPGVETIDTKVSWSLDTFPLLSEDAHDMMYEWQGRAYMKLYDTQRHRVVFILLDTPEQMIRWEQPELHRVSHHPDRLRVTSITYERDLALEEKMDRKCKIAHAYLMDIVRRAEAEHAEELTTTIEENMITENPAPPQSEMLASAPVEASANTSAPAAAEPPVPFTDFVTPSLRLGQISERLGFGITAAFLGTLGFEPAGRDKSAVLFHEHDFKAICAAILRHVSAVQAKF